MMEPFEIKNLLTVKGKSGLWRMVAIIKANGPRMVRIKNLIDDKPATVKESEVIFINNYKIFLNGEISEISLETVIDNLLEMEEKGVFTREEISVYDDLSVEEKIVMMQKLVPNYDETKFKNYHLSKLIKWYLEIMKAIDILNAGVEDPYKTNEDEIKTNEA